MNIWLQIFVYLSKHLFLLLPNLLFTFSSVSFFVPFYQTLFLGYLSSLENKKYFFFCMNDKYF